MGYRRILILTLFACNAVAQTVTPTTLPACLAADGSGVVGLALSGMTVCVPPMIGPVMVLVTASPGGPPPPPPGTSPPGTTVPPASQITDANGGVWTIATSGQNSQGFPIVLNGAATGANGVEILWDGATITMQSANSPWPNHVWMWTGSGWAQIS